MIATQETRLADLVEAVERAQGWSYDPDSRSFGHAVATHPIDSPDGFGDVPEGGTRSRKDSRSMVSIQIRYRRLQSSGTSQGQAVAAGATLAAISASLPEGVLGNWSSVEEREFFEGVSSPNSQGAPVVRTTRGVVSAGTEIEGLAARLPGGRMRLDGRLSISAFTGESRTRASVQFPLSIDGPRGKWLTVYASSALDAKATVALRGVGVKVGLAGDALEIQVRVD